jgi:hypothetical protein
MNATVGGARASVASCGAAGSRNQELATVGVIQRFLKQRQQSPPGVCCRTKHINAASEFESPPLSCLLACSSSYAPRASEHHER